MQCAAAFCPANGHSRPLALSGNITLCVNKKKPPPLFSCYLCLTLRSLSDFYSVAAPRERTTSLSLCLVCEVLLEQFVNWLLLCPYITNAHHVNTYNKNNFRNRTQIFIQLLFPVCVVSEWSSDQFFRTHFLCTVVRWCGGDDGLRDRRREREKNNGGFG